MRRFMRDQGRTAQQLCFGRCLLEEQARRTVLDSSGVLHARILERGDQCEAEFLVRVVDPRIVFKPVERGRM